MTTVTGKNVRLFVGDEDGNWQQLIGGGVREITKIYIDEKEYFHGDPHDDIMFRTSAVSILPWLIYTKPKAAR